MNMKSSRYTPATGVLLVMFVTAGAAAPGGTDKPLVLKPARTESDRPAHRDRAVTGDDYRKLAPPSPGADVHRPRAPSPETAPENDSQALNPPAIDDRSYKQLSDETRKRVPAHTPEWSNPNDSDPGTTVLDAEGGQLRFGDGEHGRRLPAGKPSPRPEYRPGAGMQHKSSAPAGPVPVPYPNAGNAPPADSSDDEKD